MSGHVTSASNLPSSRQSTNTQIPTPVLNDLCSRFIINIPEEARSDMIRVFFQIELAHWFYLDFFCVENPQLKACGIKDFSAQIFQHCPSLCGYAGNLDQILESWRDYKLSVPTYGAIMLDPTMQHCLLVQGYWAKANWGFPKGKLNEDELGHQCAIREVLEETGYDISELLDMDEFIDYKHNEQQSKLYIVRGVPLDTKFQPKTRKEIKQLKWFPVDYLPTSKKDTASKDFFNLPSNAFFMVTPFIRTLKKWIADRLEMSEHQASRGGRRARDRRHSTSESRTRHRSHHYEDRDTKSTPKRAHSSTATTPTHKAAHSPRPTSSRAIQILKKEKPKKVKPKKLIQETAEAVPFAFRAPAWQNFKLDGDAFMRAFENKLPF